MDPQHELRVWIDDELRRLGYGSSNKLARFLGVDPHTVSRMKNRNGLKETRRIEADMVPKLAEFFGCIPPGFRSFNEIRCRICPIDATVGATGDRTAREVDMPSSNNGSKERTIKIEIQTPQQGTLIVGNNNTIVTNNFNGEGVPMSPSQALDLEESIQKIAEARKSEPMTIWKELCAALNIADSALITRELVPTAQLLLAKWEQDAVRSAVNEKGY